MRGTVAKKQAKTLISLLWNRFYGIRYSIFSTLEDILSQSVVILPKFQRKCSFAVFETGFMAFYVVILGLYKLFLAPWRLFWVDWKYRCQDTGENDNHFWNQLYDIPCSIFRILEVIFRTLAVNLNQSEALLPRYKQKRSFTGFGPSFTAFAVLFLAHLGLFFVDRWYCCQNTGENVH